MKDAVIEFTSVCPACSGKCPRVSLGKHNLYYKNTNMVVDTYWYCENRDLCEWLWKHMEEINNVRPD